MKNRIQFTHKLKFVYFSFII